MHNYESLNLFYLFFSFSMYHTAGRRQKKKKNPREGNNTHVLEVKCKKNWVKCISVVFNQRLLSSFLCYRRQIKKRQMRNFQMRYCSFVQISEVIDSHAMMGVHVELNTLIMIVMIVSVQYL